MGRPGGMRRLVVASLGLLIGGPLAATPVQAATPVNVTTPAHAATPVQGAAKAPLRPGTPWFERQRATAAAASSAGGISYVTGVSFADATHGWAVGGDFNQAGILATSNGGSTWTRQAAPSNIAFLQTVQFVSPTRGWAVGNTNPGTGLFSNGAIASTADGGATWTAQTPAQTTQLSGVSFVNAFSGWVVGTGTGPIGQAPPGVILHTVDGGTTWVQQSVPTGIRSLNSVAFVDARNGVAVGSTIPAGGGVGGAAIIVTSNGGTSWTSVTAPTGLYSLISVAFAPGTTHVWAAGVGQTAGALITSPDSGATWSPQTVPTSIELDGVFMVDATHGWAVGRNYTSTGTDIGVMIATTNGGTTWTAQTVPTGTGALSGISAASISAAWADGGGACGNAAILGTANAGATWTEQLDQTPYLNDLTGVATPDATHVFVAGSDSCPNGAVLASSDAGSTWTQQTLPAGIGQLYAVSFFSFSVGWAAGIGSAPGINGGGGVIIGTSNGGQTWAAETVPAGITFLGGITFVDANHGWAVGSSGASGGNALVLATINGGVTWTQQTVPPGLTGGSLSGVYFDKDGQHGWAVGSKFAQGGYSGVALATSDGGTTWRLQTVPASVGYLGGVGFASTSTGWAVGTAQAAGGVILATTDAGNTWTPQGVPPNTNSLQAVAAVTAQTAWAMGALRDANASNGPLKTTNGGTTWSEQPISRDLYSLQGGSFLNTTTGWTAGDTICTANRSYPAVYHTTDGGAVWATQYGGCPTAGSGPAVNGLVPDSGPEPGGTSITISGARLTGATAVTFGGTPAASFQVVSDTSITAVSPAGTGTADVRVVTPAGTSQPTSADLFTWLPAVSVLPAMANGAYGGYVTVAYIKNTAGSAARASIAYFDQDGHATGVGDRMSLPVNGQATIRQDNGHGLAAGGAGSAIVYSDQPLAAFVNEFAPGPTDATSYTAVPFSSQVGPLYAPAIANGAYGGYTTGIGLLNLGSAPTDITITYRDSAGGIAKTQTIPAVPSRAYRGVYSGDATLALPVGFAGTATIQSTSTPAQPLAAVVNETGPRGQFSSYDAVSSGSTTLNAPIMLNGGYGGYYTGMGIQNTSGTGGTVTVQFYDASGTHVTPDVTQSIAANAYLPLYQGAAGQGPPASASGYTGVLTSTVPIAAVVNEVAPPSATPTQSTSYNTFPAGAGTIHLALVENAGSDGWTTGLGVMNTGSAITHVTVTYYDAATGSQVGVTQQTDLAPHAFYGPYQGAPSILPPGQRATAVLTTTAGGTIAVVCNEQGAHALMSYSGQ